MNLKNGKGEIILIRKTEFSFSMQILGSDQTTAIWTDTLDYSKNFGGGARPVVLPKGFIQAGMEIRTESFILCRKGEKIRQC